MASSHSARKIVYPSIFLAIAISGGWTMFTGGISSPAVTTSQSPPKQSVNLENTPPATVSWQDRLVSAAESCGPLEDRGHDRPETVRQAILRGEYLAHGRHPLQRELMHCLAGQLSDADREAWLQWCFRGATLEASREADGDVFTSAFYTYEAVYNLSLDPLLRLKALNAWQAIAEARHAKDLAHREQAFHDPQMVRIGSYPIRLTMPEWPVPPSGSHPNHSANQ